VSAQTTNTSSPARRIAIIGLLVNVALALVKLIAGIVGHSGALIADAIESLADIAGSIVIWGGLKIGSMPADEDHPFGHGKAESIAGLVVACILVVAGIGIAVESVHNIRTPHDAPAPWTLGVLVFVVIVKTALYLAARRVAKRENSGALEVDAGHHVADAITSLAAGIGIAIAVFGQRWFGGDPVRWATADDWAALFASAIILWNAWTLLKIPMHELMDTSGPADEAAAIDPAKREALAVHGVKSIEKTFVRKSGGRYWMVMHVHVDPDMPVREAHIVGGKVRSAIRANVPRVRDVLIHIEPAE
jgi:cation diffusion facilitator family transporter